MTRQEVIDLYFEGDRSLHDEYAEACRAQFAVDVEHGDAACAQGDLAAMRHLAHGLKTLLQTMGRSDLSELARAIEEASVAGDKATTHEAWSHLRAALPTALDG